MARQQLSVYLTPREISKEVGVGIVRQKCLCVCGGEGRGGGTLLLVLLMYVLVNAVSFLNSSSYEQMNGF